MLRTITHTYIQTYIHAKQGGSALAEAHNGQTPLDIAREYKMDDVIRSMEVCMHGYKKKKSDLMCIH